MGCTFCATASMGFGRHLLAHEIVGQVLVAMHELGPRHPGDLTLVFMGMGEPLHNLAQVARAIAVLCHPAGLGLSARRITVSTSGLVPEIAELGRLEPRPLLAISVNATTDEQRSALMPIGRRYPLAELQSALERFPLRPRERITVEYVLLAGVNDSPDGRPALSQLLRQFSASNQPDPIQRAPRLRVLRADRSGGRSVCARSPRRTPDRAHRAPLTRSGRGRRLRATGARPIAVSLAAFTGTTLRTRTPRRPLPSRLSLRVFSACANTSARSASRRASWPTVDRLVQHARRVALQEQPRVLGDTAAADEHEALCEVWPATLCFGEHIHARQARHHQIAQHQIEAIAGVFQASQRIATIAHDLHGVTAELPGQSTRNQRIVVDDQKPSITEGWRRGGRDVRHLGVRATPCRQQDTHGRADAELALDLDLAAQCTDDAEGHEQTETRALVVRFGRKERFE